MPNYCDNQLTVTPHTRENLDKFVKALSTEVDKVNQLFNTFLPTPEELLDNGGWYNWRIDNWGTKWNAISVDSHNTESNDPTKQIFVTFETAYSPPIEFYKHLESLGFTVYAEYLEPGYAFVGKYHKGEDTCYNLTAETIKVVAVMDLLDGFGQLEDFQEQYAEDEENV